MRTSRAAVPIFVMAAVLQFNALALGQSPAAEALALAQRIDREIDAALTMNGVKASSCASDADFLRRVSLDITGRIPTAEQAEAFLSSTAADKRRKLIDELLVSPLYGEHQASIWTDRIRATGTPPASMTGAFRKWLADAFNQGRGWDKIAHSLLTASGGGPEEYFVRANYKEPGPLANTAARFFLGVRIECAECHDHPFNEWKQTDYWGMAAFFTRLNQVKGKGGSALNEDPIPGKKSKLAAKGAAIMIPGSGVRDGAGKVVLARFLHGAEPKLPDEGAIRPSLAQWMVAKDNPYFARAAVNRTWGHFFGRGFVNPVDDFNDNVDPSHPKLLGHLSRAFADSGFDLKHLIRAIANSQAYQRSSAPLAENKDDATLFSHMTVKVMRADVLFDSIVTALGNPKLPGGLGSPLPYEIYSGGASKAAKPNARDEFIRFFDTADDSGDASTYSHGIPQILALMNAGQFNATPPLVDRLVKEKAPRDKAIETLFLAALTRPPTPHESKLMGGYLDRRADLAQGYAGVLWILLNTNEFVLNR